MNTLIYKKHLCSILLMIFCLIGTQELQAQSFFGYQTIGRNTFFFSVSWQGKPLLGMGYNFRGAGKTFTDWQAELRFPLNGMYKFDEFQVISGIYKPFSIDRAFMGSGVHLRYQKTTLSDEKTNKLSLALTLLPTYTYAASLNDGAYGTIALRATYAPVLLAIRQNGSEKSAVQALAAHKLELGGHLDLHMERTLGLGINGFLTHDFLPKNSILNKEEGWKWEGDFYMGSTYWLRRN